MNTGGLETTLKALKSTRNDAAVPVLLSALKSQHLAVSEGALRMLLDRKSPQAQKELLQRWGNFRPRWKEITAARPGRLPSALRDAVLTSDPELFRLASDAVVYIREYDLLPSLLVAAEEKSNPLAGQAAATVLRLAELLYEELSRPRDYSQRRDPNLVRQHVVGALENSVKRFAQHKKPEMLEAFLLLSERDNATLKRVLSDPHDAAYLSMIDLLARSERVGVMRLLLNYLSDNHAPLAILNLLLHREDRIFIQRLLKKVGFEPAVAVQGNLKRVENIPWLLGDQQWLLEGEESQQHSAVQLAVCSGMSRLDVYGFLKVMLTRGKTAGRRAAARALAAFKGADANQLVMECRQDADPQTQANLLRQLRERGIPGAMQTLIESLASPHAEVQQAARDCLQEFRFERFLSSFEILEEDVRRSTGRLVRRVDPGCLAALRQEMTAPARGRRLRALEIVPYLEAVADLEETIIRLLSDSDHFVRGEAAQALGTIHTPASEQALREALLDRSVAVQQAAAESLQRLGLSATPPPLDPWAGPSPEMYLNPEQSS